MVQRGALVSEVLEQSERCELSNQFFVDIFDVLARLRSHSLNNDTIVTFQIQSNLDIQLSFFPAVSWGCAEEPPTEDYEDCITEERWESIFKINFKMFISQLYKLYIGNCCLAAPIQYNQ